MKQHRFVHRADADMCSECSETAEHTNHPQPKQRNHSAASNIAGALSTYIERNKTYGNSYHKFGHVMAALFPNGLVLNTVEDFNRYGVFFMQISKIVRYTTAPQKGHLDSVHDLGVYSFMLEELDALAQGLPVVPGVKPRIDPAWCEHIWDGDICLACDTDRTLCIHCNMKSEDHIGILKSCRNAKGAAPKHYEVTR